MKRTLLAIVATLMMALSVSANQTIGISWRTNPQMQCNKQDKKQPCPQCNKKSKKDKKQDKDCKCCKKGNQCKGDKKGKPSYGKGKREFSNNSPEAIRMRQKMRRGAMKGAR